MFQHIFWFARILFILFRFVSFRSFGMEAKHIFFAWHADVLFIIMLLKGKKVI